MKRQKNASADADAICEAAERDTVCDHKGEATPRVAAVFRGARSPHSTADSMYFNGNWPIQDASDSFLLMSFLLPGRQGQLRPMRSRKGGRGTCRELSDDPSFVLQPRPTMIARRLRPLWRLLSYLAVFLRPLRGRTLLFPCSPTLFFSGSASCPRAAKSQSLPGRHPNSAAAP